MFGFYSVRLGLIEEIRRKDIQSILLGFFRRSQNSRLVVLMVLFYLMCFRVQPVALVSGMVFLPAVLIFGCRLFWHRLKALKINKKKGGLRASRKKY